MIKNIKNAFTLIEILLSITIISFLSVSAISYFHNFVGTKKLDSELSLFKSSIENLDMKVRNKDIYDYELSFSWTKLHYFYVLNQSVNKTKTIFTFDENNKDFSLKTSLNYTWAWDIKIYNEDKLLSKKILDLKEEFTWKLDLYSNYDIKSTIELNTDLFWTYLFSEDNLDSSGITTDFVWAYQNADKSWFQTQNFKLKNINNKLQFYSWSTFWDLSSVYLFFQKAWVEKSIKIWE